MNLRQGGDVKNTKNVVGYTTVLTHPTEFTPYESDSQDAKIETQKILDALGIDIDFSDEAQTDLSGEELK